MDSQKKIIITFLILFFLSSVFLSWTEQKQADPNLGKNWWTVYFDEPKSLSWNFSIENHGDKTDFKYEVLDGTNKIYEDVAIINKGELRQINLNQKIGGIENKKITVRVSDDVEKKEIYKDF